MAMSVSEAKKKLNEQTCPVASSTELGNLVLGVDITDTIDLDGFTDGDVVLLSVDHSALGAFAHASVLPTFGAAPGFIIRPVLADMSTTVFVVEITYDADKFVYTDGDIGTPAGAADPGVAGAATVTWHRVGPVLPS